MKKELTTKDLMALLAGTKIRLSCGHVSTIGHNLANTLVVVSQGGGNIKTMCHS